MGVSIVLFTRNLRVHDNPVLMAAAAAGPVVPLFVIDEAIRASGYVTPNRASFLAESLADLDAALLKRGARLVVRRGRVVDEVCRVAQEVGAEKVHVAADVSGYDRIRRRRLENALTGIGRELVVHDAVVTAVAAGELTPQGRDHFSVFTPYHRRWVVQPKRHPESPPAQLEMPPISASALPTAEQLCPGVRSANLAAGGESEARRRMRAWSAKVGDYEQGNDMLAADATSRLSPYLHFGCLSAVELVARCDQVAGAEGFVRQLAWRDFHHQVLAARPAAARQDYRHRGDQWRRDDEALAAWRNGCTGYPIVDAGMRQLAAEGWMHNRARLIVASFLTKTLYLDWRCGARHFLDLLVDGDIANNQMNWQWMAGTGTDTRPNRVLNPLTQARRYDPDGGYVRRYVPELADIQGAAVHQPWKLDADRRRRLDYPDPIVDLDDARRRFHAARG